MLLRKHLLALCVLACLGAIPSSAAAQSDDGESPLILRITAGAFIFSLLSTSTYLTVVHQMQLRKNEQMKEEIKELETLVLLDGYMRGNLTGLQQDLALGSDMVLRDVAEILAVPMQDYAAWHAHVLTQRDMFDDAHEVHDLYHALKLPDGHHAACALSASNTSQELP